MKTLWINTILLLIVNSIFAQKNFEGKIIYKINSGSPGESAVITAYFGNQKIKADYKNLDSARDGKESVLLDFEKGIVYYINARAKTYRANNILDKNMDRMPAIKPLPEKNKQLLGYSCAAYITTDTSRNEYMAFNPFYFWYADSLFFKVKNEYSNIDMVPFFTNGTRVGMGVQMNLGHGWGELNVELSPIAVKEQPVTDTVFALTGLQLEINRSYMPEDSTQIKADSIDKVVQRPADSVVQMISQKAKLVKKTASKKTHGEKIPTQPIRTPISKPKE